MPSPELQDRMQVMRERFAVVPTIEERRAGSAAISAIPEGIAVDVIALGSVTAETLQPTADAVLNLAGTIVYFHGGGYVAGSPAIARPFLADLAREAKVRVISPAYRLAPECPFPAAVDDALVAYRAVVEMTPDPTRLVVGGTSAGGGLAIATLVAARDEGLPLPAAAFVISPFVDMTLSSASMRASVSDDPIAPTEIRESVRHYLAGRDPHLPLASPAYADLAGLPPLHIEVGTADRLVDDSRLLASQAAKQGVLVTCVQTEGAMHSFPHFAADAPESRAAVTRIVDHVTSALY